MISHLVSRSSRTLPRRADRARLASRRRSVFMLERVEDRTLLSNWIGAVGGGDGLSWSDARNWDAGVPSATNPAVINGSVTVNLGANAAARSLTLTGGATLNLNDYTLSVNTASNTVAQGFKQEGGIVRGGDGAALRVAGNFTVDAGGTFDVANVTFVGGKASAITSDVRLNNVTIDYGAHHLTIADGHPLNVKGNLTFLSYGSIRVGDINAYGAEVTSSAIFVSETSTATLNLKGTGDQTLSGAGGAGALPRVVNEKPANTTLKVTGSISPETWTQVSGKLAAASSTTTFRRIPGNAPVDTGSTQLGNVVVQTGTGHFRVKQLNVGGNLTINSAQSFTKAAGGADAVKVYGDLSSTAKSPISGGVGITMVGGTSKRIYTGTLEDGKVVPGTGHFPSAGIIINKGSASLSANVTTPLSGTLEIQSVWAINGGPLTVGGNVITHVGMGGNATLVFAGGAKQTLTTTKDGAGVVGVRIDKSGGSLTLNTDESSRTLRVNGSWIVAGDNVGAINLAGSTIRFTAASGGGITVDGGSSPMTFNDVEVAIGSTDLNAQKMIVDGKLTLTSVHAISGVITANSDVETKANAINSGGGRIEFVGTGDQHLSASSPNGGVPAVVINKPGGTLFIEGSDTINANGNWTWTKGAVDATGSTVRLTNANNVNTGPGNGGMKFNNFQIAVGGNTLKIENKLAVLGDLTLNSAWAINAALGAITVGGDLTSTAELKGGGSANITMVGNGKRHTNITAVPTKDKNGNDVPSHFPSGGIIINTGQSWGVTANVLTPLRSPLTTKFVSFINGVFTVGKDVTAEWRTGGTGTIVFAGGNDQTLKTTANDARVPGVLINKSGGKLTLDGGHVINVNGSWIVDGDNKGEIIATDTTVRFTGAATVDTGLGAHAMTFNDVEVAIGASPTLTVEKMVVDGNLTLTSVNTIKGGMIEAHGDVTTKATGAATSNGGGILFTGDRDQTLKATGNNARVPAAKIDKTGGKLTIAATDTENGSYPIGVTGDWTHEKGNVHAAGSTVRLLGGNSTVDSGTMRFGNVVVEVGDSPALNVNKMVVDGELTLKSAGKINGANIDAYGDVTTEATKGMAGASRIRFLGWGKQQLSAAANNNKMPGVIINKWLGKLTIGANTIDVTGNWDYHGLGFDVDAITNKSTIRFTNGNTTVRPGLMVFYNVDFAVGSSGKAEILAPIGDGPGVLFHLGSVENAGKVKKGRVFP